MVVKSGQVEYRLIRRWFAEEKRFCLWMTNVEAMGGKLRVDVELPTGRHVGFNV